MRCAARTSFSSSLDTTQPFSLAISLYLAHLTCIVSALADLPERSLEPSLSSSSSSSPPPDREEELELDGGLERAQK